MELAAAATASSTVAISRLTTSSFPATNFTVSSSQRNRALSLRSSSSSYSSRSSLSTNAAFFSSGAVGESYGISKRNPDAIHFPASVTSPRPRRSFIARIIPHKIGDEIQPPDLISYLFKHRIVYLGATLYPRFTKMLVAEFLFLGFEDVEKPIYLYINSTGTNKNQRKPSYEQEALTIHDTMQYSRAPVFTLCVGNAWGEAALLLASGAKGKRASLPSASIMIKEAVGGFQGHTTDVERARQRLKAVRSDIVNLLATHTRQPRERIEADYTRPKYFNPSEAIEYGIIDKILYSDRDAEDRTGNGGIINTLKQI
ncbi:ATP-dependent Clp protease proteolytic subunit-related protein 4, chloroplastic [Linum grandiflorum]